MLNKLLKKSTAHLINYLPLLIKNNLLLTFKRFLLN